MNNRPSVLPWRSVNHSEGRVLLVTLTFNAARRARARALGRKVPYRPRIVATFGEHGRERITSEIALAVMKDACEHPRMAQLLRMEYVIMPIVNEAGRRAVESGDTCERLNGALVDLNRNYLVGWGVKDSDTNPDEEAAGVHALSEFESRAVDAVLRRVVPVAFVAFHSGDAAVVIPWDSRKVREKSARMDNVERVANHVRKHHCDRCRIGNAWQLVKYRAYGTAADHAFGALQIPVVLTVEVYGDVSAGDDDCVRSFNPSEGAIMQSVLRKWQDVLGTLSDAVATYGTNDSRSSLYDAVTALGYAGYEVRVYDDVYTSGRDDGSKAVVKKLRVGSWVIMASWGSLIVLAIRQAIRKRGMQDGGSIEHNVTSPLSRITNERWARLRMWRRSRSVETTARDGIDGKQN